MIEIDVAKAIDLYAFIPRPVFHGEIPYMSELVDYVERRDCVAHTLSIKGEPFAVLGAVPFGDGVLCVWGWFGEAIKKYPLEFCKISRIALTSYISAFNPREVFMTVKVGFEDALKWSKFLGFKIVDTIVGVDGSDYYKMMRAV